MTGVNVIEVYYDPDYGDFEFEVPANISEKVLKEMLSSVLFDTLARKADINNVNAVINAISSTCVRAGCTKFDFEGDSFRLLLSNDRSTVRIFLADDINPDDIEKAITLAFALPGSIATVSKSGVEIGIKAGDKVITFTVENISVTPADGVVAKFKYGQADKLLNVFKGERREFVKRAVELIRREGVEVSDYTPVTVILGERDSVTVFDAIRKKEVFVELKKENV